MEDEEKLHSEETPLASKDKDAETSQKPSSYTIELEVGPQPTSDESKTSPKIKRKFSVLHVKQQVEKARKDSPNRGLLAFTIFGILCGSAITTIGLLVLAVLPIAMIAIGAYYLHDCPGRNTIPIWLIVFGSVSLLVTLLDIIKQIFGCAASEREDTDKQDWNKNKDYGCGCCQSLITLFLFAWIIAGSVWVFGYWEQFQATRDVPCVAPNNCCHPVPYLFSFVTLIVMYVIGILSCIIGCCFCCVCICCAATLAAISGS